MDIKLLSRKLLSNNADQYAGSETEFIPIKGQWIISSPQFQTCINHSGLSDSDLNKSYTDYYKNNRRLPPCCQPKIIFRKNTVVNGLINTIIHKMTNTATGTEDLVARKLAVGTNNNLPQQANIQLGLEKFRSDFTDQFQDGTKAVFVLFVNRTTGNGNESLVVADAGNSVTQIKITPATATSFNIGDRIRVLTTSTENFTNITNINLANDILTLDPLEPLSEAPVAGKQVIQVWAEAGIFGNATAGSSVNTGTLYNRVNQIEFVKDSTKIILIEVQFLFTPQ